ncbi:sulfite exporter TauE/SafE family protein [Acidihalobacter prosperus]|uniref:Probable membrane transporter protein n=1 Tax=Acidihalobacter prosperus TaxID=160660 RepID=A0A1A6C573_9GAMM|nr:sulfite exporter TauE/SafE family protein [Acidihalobacter prosperus]OBS09695.1 hypothetical protein Thpro_022023 [Acidihalobacter prosperus]
MDWTLVTTGLLIAALIAVTGIGGGSLMTPALILGCGLAPTTAVGTDLLYATFTKSGALLAYARDRRVDWATVGWLLAGGVPGVAAAHLFLSSFHDAALQDRLVGTAVACVLALSALGLLLPRRRGHVARPPAAIRRWLIASGATVAVLVTLSSIGAGTLTGALLTLLYPERPLAEIVGTELAMAVPLAALAAGAHFLSGQVDWRAAVDLSIGSLPGIWLGRQLMHRLPDRWLRLATAALLAGASITLIA